MRVLVVEDDRIVRVTVTDALEEARYVVCACSDGTSALRAVEHEAFDIVLSDVRLPGVSGIELFRRVRELQPDAAVILMTAFADTDDAVSVMREGARDYIAKPFEIDELLLRMARVRQELEFRRDMHRAGAATAHPERHPVRGTCPATRRLIERIDAAAASDVSVLITGETGTGKDVCARAIHQRGRRAQAPFVAVNCPAIPESLFEAELFGHEKGAFTGADRRRVGRLEAADGGTLFLDEVSELPLGNQAKLLRALESSTFEPLGSARSVSVDIRIVAATNRDLAAAVASGAFRQDLYYRLNVIDIDVPPLRERRADIPELATEFLTEICARHGRMPPALQPSAMAALATYEYPGNVRELIHVLERAVALTSGGAIGLENLPARMVAAVSGRSSADAAPPGVQLESLSRAVGQFERQYMRHVLESVGGHRGRAAAILGISRKTLWQRLRDDSD